MQYVNDDMDELFRSAAENYPLDVSKPDWGKVYNVLKEKDDIKPADNNNHRKYLWLLCLLPLGLVCNHFFPVGKLSTGKSSEQTIKKTTVEKKGTISSSKNDEMTVTQIIHSETDKAGVIKKEAIIKVIPDDSKTSSQNNVSHKDKNRNSAVTQTLNKNYLLTQSSIKEPFAFSNNGKATDENNHLVASSFAALTSNYPGKTVTLKSLNANHSNVAGESSKPVADAKRKTRKFYVGFIGGADLTTVRLQKTDRTGSHYGGLIGYNFGKKWSVEAGVFTDKKFYYTEGKYFNTSKVYIPANSKITEVSGDCKMLEIPISVKYDFSSSKKSAWFATAGVSSYLMKKENYSFVYYYSTSGTQATYNKSYRNSSTNLFSVVQLSAGYTHTLGNTTAFRIEPYLKLPVSGIGFGKLPLISTGVNVGVIKKVF